MLSQVFRSDWQIFLVQILPQSVEFLNSSKKLKYQQKWICTLKNFVMIFAFSRIHYQWKLLEKTYLMEELVPLNTQEVDFQRELFKVQIWITEAISTNLCGNLGNELEFKSLALSIFAKSPIHNYFRKYFDFLLTVTVRMVLGFYLNLYLK